MTVGILRSRGVLRDPVCATQGQIMTKAKIIVELENMVVARLFSRQPWLADRECHIRKLLELGLWECISLEPCIWRITPLGKELDVELFNVFLGMTEEWEVPMILERYRLIDSEADAFYSMERQQMRVLF